MMYSDVLNQIKVQWARDKEFDERMILRQVKKEET